MLVREAGGVSHGRGADLNDALDVGDGHVARVCEAVRRIGLVTVVWNAVASSRAMHSSCDERRTDCDWAVVVGVPEVAEDDLVDIAVAAARATPGLDARSVLGVLDVHVVDVYIFHNVWMLHRSELGFVESRGENTHPSHRHTLLGSQR